MEDAISTAALALAVGKDAHLDDILREYGIDALLGEMFSSFEGEYAEKVETVAKAALRSGSCLELTTAPDSMPKWAAAVSNSSAKRIQLLALQALEHLVLAFPEAAPLAAPDNSLAIAVAGVLSEEDTAVASAAASLIRAMCVLHNTNAAKVHALVQGIFGALEPQLPAALAEGSLLPSRVHDLVLRIAGDSSAGASAVSACGAVDAAAGALLAGDPLAALALLESLPACVLSPGGVAACMLVLNAACRLAGAELAAQPPSTASDPPPQTLALPPSPHTIAQSLQEPDAFTGEQALRVAASTVRSACSTVLTAAAGRISCSDVGPPAPPQHDMGQLLEKLLHIGHGLLCRAFLQIASAASEEGALTASLAALSDLLSAHPLLCVSAASHAGLVRNLARLLAGSNTDVRDAALYCLAHVMAAPAVLAQALGISAASPPASLSRSDPEAVWVHAALLKSHMHTAAASQRGAAAAVPAVGVSRDGGGHAALSEGGTQASDPSAVEGVAHADGGTSTHGLIPSEPAASPLILGEACAQLLGALDTQLAQRPGAAEGSTCLVDIAHSCVLSPFPGPSSAASAALLALASLPTGWGIARLLHTSVRVSTWLSGGAPPGEGAPQRRRRMELVYALLAHPRCEERAGAVQYAALAAVASPPPGAAAQGVQVATESF